MDGSGGGGGPPRGGSSSATGGLTAFLYLGFMGTLGFSGIHLLFCLLTSWVLGHDFSTVVFVTSATLLTGTVITFTFAFLVLINVVITAFSNFSQFGQNMFGGGGSGAQQQQQQRSSSSSNISSRNHRQPSSSLFNRMAASSATAFEDEDVYDNNDIKLD